MSIAAQLSRDYRRFMTRETRRTFIAQAAAGMTLASCHSAAQQNRLAVFDAVWGTVNEQYFDPAMEGIDWQQVRRAWRPRALKAISPAELYLDVLAPLLDQFQASHVVIQPPRAFVLPAGRGFQLPRQKDGLPPIFTTPEDEAGMGAVLTWTGTAYIVEDVTYGGAAYAAGLRPGQSVLLRGFRGASANGRRLELVDTSSSTRFTVNWTPGASRSGTEAQPLGSDALCVRLNTFDRSSVDWAMGQLDKTSGSVVLDLRQNTGGLIVETVRLLSMLLPVAADLGLFRSRERDYRLQSDGAPDPFSGRLAVLIGARTMSGAEVMAALLQHFGRARLFGLRTAGAVLAARTFDLPDGGRLTLPYADYFTPAGQRIEDRGVTPDVRAPRTARSSADRSDPALDAALTWLRTRQ